MRILLMPNFTKPRTWELLGELCRRMGALGLQAAAVRKDREAMEALPEDSTVFGELERPALLDALLPMTVDALVDREAGTVREEAVRSFLAFCAAAPLRTEGVEDIYTAALNGELLLLPAELTRLDSCAEVQVYTTAFGGSCSYVGYPREDGGAGSFFRLWDGISMASGCKNKEAAWSFLREAFLPKYPTGIYFGPALPISRADFDRMAEISTGPMLDETGQPMETAGPACVMMPDSDLAIPIRPVTQEEYGHFMVLFNAVDSRNQLDVLLDGVVLVGAAVAAYGILQYMFRWGYQSASWVDSDMFSSIEFRVPSTLDNPNMLGQYLILAIPIGGAKLLSAKDWFSRVFYFGCCGVMCVCMLLTFSRGAWLGLLFAGAVFVVLLNPRLILLFPLALAALWFVLPDTVTARFASIGNLGDASTSYRVYIWMGTLAMLKNYWLCGIGPGNEAFNAVYAKYSFSAVTAPHSHNLFLQLVCDAGITALAVFLILIFVYFRMMCAALHREKDWTSRMYQTAFTGGVCGFLVQAMTDYSFYNYRVLFIFWAYLALGALSARRSGLPEGRLLA